MPEGPEVETVRRSLLPLLVGATLGNAFVSSKALRTRVTAKALTRAIGGRTVAKVERHGKALFIDMSSLDERRGLQVRLGMTGKLIVVDATAPREPHTHVRIGIHSAMGPRELRYVDARRFGEVVPYQSEDERRALARDMGPDGLALDDAARVLVAASLAASKRALKDVLLDQTVVAGVGNIYAAEILFRARLSPFRAARSLKRAEASALLDATAGILAEAVERRGTSFSDYVDANGDQGDNQAHLAVFQRAGEPCPACASPIKRAVQGARSTFYCPRCQHTRKSPLR